MGLTKPLQLAQVLLILVEVAEEQGHAHQEALVQVDQDL
jgi:hypothetical protein